MRRRQRLELFRQLRSEFLCFPGVYIPAFFVIEQASALLSSSSRATPTAMVGFALRAATACRARFRAAGLRLRLIRQEGPGCAPMSVAACTFGTRCAWTPPRRGHSSLIDVVERVRESGSPNKGRLAFHSSRSFAGVAGRYLARDIEPRSLGS